MKRPHSDISDEYLFPTKNKLLLTADLISLPNVCLFLVQSFLIHSYDTIFMATHHQLHRNLDVFAAIKNVYWSGASNHIYYQMVELKTDCFQKPSEEHQSGINYWIYFLSKPLQFTENILDEVFPEYPAYSSDDALVGKKYEFFKTTCTSYEKLNLCDYTKDPLD
jgi:hypothetical protein